MIFIHDKIYAKVWNVDKHEKYIDLQVTTSEKDGDGNYLNSGWFPRLIGHAFQSLKDVIKEGDRLVITKCKMTNERYKDAENNTKSRFKFVVLEARIEENDGNVSAAHATQSTEENMSTKNAESGCPW